MKIKRVFKFFSILAIASVIVVACSDDFNEEDFVKLQAELAKQTADENAEALALASVLQALTIQVQEDEVPLEGVTVTVANPGAAEISATSNANGNATFTGVIIGGNTINVSLDGYVSAQVVVDFGEVEENEEFERIDNKIVPIPRSESMVIPMISRSATSGSTATIKGKVTIESDLTNDVAEIPQGIQIRANFDDNMNVVTSSGTTVNSYTFNDGLGVADVDGTTGEYSLLIPASASGSDIELLIPDILLDQIVAVDELDGENITPEFRNVPTMFGPNCRSGYDAVPTVNGAKAVFDAPPAAGTGFKLGNFTRYGRSIPTFTISNADLTNIDEDGNDDMVVQFTSLGAGYTASPTVAITDASGTGAEAEAHIEYAVGGINVSTDGSGYAASTGVTMTIRYADAGGSNSNDRSITVTSSATGTITQTEVTAAVTAAIENGINGFDVDDLREIFEVSTGFSVIWADAGGAATPPTGTVSIASSKIWRFAVTDGGDEYTQPSFTFSGGSATTQAALTVHEFGTNWLFNVDNTESTTYSTIPEDMFFQYKEVDPDAENLNTSSSAIDVEFGNSFNLENILTISGGNLVFESTTATYRTSFRSFEMPTFIVETSEVEIAEASVEINSEGVVTDLDVDNNGEGYASPFQVTIEPAIEGAAGSGASITLTRGTFDEYDQFNWDEDFQIISGGSGYLENLNQADLENFAGSTSMTVKAGEVRTNNIVYGTGDKQENVGR